MSDQDDILVTDAATRRRFLKTGAAALTGAAAFGGSSNVLAADCDRNPRDAESKQAAAGSDSDDGASADAAGCGRTPTISQAPAPSDGPVRIATLKG